MLLRLFLLLLLTLPCLAQGMGELPLDVVVIKPRQVYLVPGGETKSVRLQGNNFELVERVDVLRGAHKVPQIRVELQRKSTGIYTLLLSASKEAQFGNDYRVRLASKTEHHILNLDLEVVDPNNPPP